MSFERDYPTILKQAKKKVFNLVLNVDAEELVSQAYINLYNKPYSIDIFFKEIGNLALYEKHDTPSNINFGDVGGTSGDFIGDSTCIKCKGVKSADEYRIENTVWGRKVLRTMCKVCEAEYKKQYSIIVNKQRFGVTYNKKSYEKVKSTDKFKKQNKRRVRTFISKHRKQWNEYIKERDQADRKNLSDTYLKKILREKGFDTNYLNQHPELIIEQRDKINNKRLAKVK